MFDFFKKKKVDEEKVQAFCEWFIAKQEEIIRTFSDDRLRGTYINEAEKQLSYVYSDGYQGKIEFGYGCGKNGTWQLDLWHFNKKFLVSATTQIAEILNRRLSGIWEVRVGA